MENRVIKASLSTQSIAFRPGGAPASFEVTVINGSDQFAAFQLEVLAAGTSRSSGPRWYRLSPEVSSAKPPGDSTVFKIVIFDTPLPAFVGTINLTVRIFSPQIREERKLLVRLTIEPHQLSNVLSVELPIQRFQVYPHNSIEIPVRVRNLSPQSVDAVLRFTGLDPAWLMHSTERRLLLEPGSQVETTFQCQPPSATQAPSQDYPFTIEALSRDNSPVPTTGFLEVLPVGFVEFTAEPQQQTIPSHGGWLPDWKSDAATFVLLFKNASNLHQQVNVQLQGKDREKCIYELVSEDAALGPGETTKIPIKVKTKRAWLGLGKTLRLEAKALLSDQRLGSTDPATQSLELQILPIVPLWLLLTLLALLAALLALILRPPSISHTDFVNSVRLSGNTVLVLSGSDDCTIRRWEVNGNDLEPRGILTKSSSVACNGKPLKPKGVLAVTDKPVRALRFDPVNDQRVAAGLENGEIQLWDVPTGTNKGVLKDQNDTTSDKVFDLIFTKDSRFLFSGHGSGKVRVWGRQSPNSEFQAKQAELSLSSRLNYQVRALALSQDESTLVSAGQYKRLILWERSQWEHDADGEGKVGNNRPKLISIEEPSGQGQNDYFWGLAFAPSLPGLLATSDSDGYITIWDLAKCQDTNSTTTSQLQEPIEQKCERHDHWRAAAVAVRSLAFSTNDSQLKLVSAGDDGRVVVWPLTSAGKLDLQQAAKGQEIYRSSKKLNSIDLATDNQGTMIVSGGEDFQVKLHRLR